MTSSHELKTAALWWLRYRRQNTHCATEAGRWNADVVGLDGDRLVEFEVKVDRYDLRAEFVRKPGSKTTKHAIYRGTQGGRGLYFSNHDDWAPHAYYVLVPEALKAEALSALAAFEPRYGVAVYDPERGGPRWDERVVVERRAKMLHRRDVADHIAKALANRATSDLCQLYAANQAAARAHEAALAMSREICALGQPIREPIAEAVEDESIPAR